MRKAWIFNLLHINWPYQQILVKDHLSEIFEETRHLPSHGMQFHVEDVLAKKAFHRNQLPTKFLWKVTAWKQKRASYLKILSLIIWNLQENAHYPSTLFHSFLSLRLPRCGYPQRVSEGSWRHCPAPLGVQKWMIPRWLCLSYGWWLKIRLTSWGW